MSLTVYLGGGGPIDVGLQSKNRHKIHTKSTLLGVKAFY